MSSYAALTEVYEWLMSDGEDNAGPGTERIVPRAALGTGRARSAGHALERLAGSGAPGSPTRPPSRCPSGRPQGQEWRRTRSAGRALVRDDDEPHARVPRGLPGP